MPSPTTNWVTGSADCTSPTTIAPDPYQHLPTSPRLATQKLHSNLSAQCHIFEIPGEATTGDLTASITDVQYIGSYNWVSDHEKLCIIVPGSPREWQEQQLPYTVAPDIEGHYREQYDQRMRSTPLLPLLLAVNHYYERAHPQPAKFPWGNVDFITNRNSLRHLLRIFHPDTSSTGGNSGSNSRGARGGKRNNRGSFHNPYSKPFRIDIDLAGTKTILLNRWEPSASEPLFVNSYGFNFESAFTREADAVSSLDEAGETARHHRINSYDFGGLQMVVRSEIDASLPLDESLDENKTNGQNSWASPIFQPLSTSFGLTIIPSPNPPTPQTHLIELSTTKASTFPTWNARERYPQLYFAQVPNHYLASHINGTVSHIDKRNLHSSPEIRFYAPNMESKLKRLRKLLEMIQSTVILQASLGTHKSFSLVYLQGRLSLYERVGERYLPDAVFAMFDV